jgi:hypothetical protein
MPVLMRNDSSMNPSVFNMDGKSGPRPSALPRVEAPMPQRTESLDIDRLRVSCEYGSYQDEFGGFYDPEDVGFVFDEEPDWDTPEDLIDAGCRLMRDTIT